MAESLVSPAHARVKYAEELSALGSSFNPFAYNNQNPTTSADPISLQPLEDFLINRLGPNVEFYDNTTLFKKPIMIMDTPQALLVNLPKANDRGLLFKNQDDSNLYWYSNNSLHPLTNGAKFVEIAPSTLAFKGSQNEYCLIFSPKGIKTTSGIDPGYAFVHNPTSGLFSSTPTNLGLTLNGKPMIILSPNKIELNGEVLINGSILKDPTEEILNVQNAINEIRLSLADFPAQFSQLHDAMQQSSVSVGEKITSTGERIALAEEKISSVQSQLQNYIDTNNKNLDLREQHIVESTEKLTSSQLEQTKSTLEQTKSSLETLIQKTLSMCEEKLAGFARSLDEQKATIQQAQFQSGENQDDKIKQQQVANQELMEKISKIQEEISTFEANLHSRISENIHQNQEIITKITPHLAELSAEIQKTKSDFEQLKTQLTVQSDNKNNEHTQRITELALSVQVLQDSIISKNAEISDQFTRLTNKIDGKLSSLSSELETSQHNFSQQTQDKFQALNNAMVDQKQSLHDEITDGLQAATTKIHEIKISTDALITQTKAEILQTTSDANNEQTKKIDELNLFSKRMNVQISELQISIAAISELKTKLERLETVFQEHATHLDKLAERQESQSKIVATLTADMLEFRNELSHKLQDVDKKISATEAEQQQSLLPIVEKITNNSKDISYLKDSEATRTLFTVEQSGLPPGTPLGFFAHKLIPLSTKLYQQDFIPLEKPNNLINSQPNKYFKYNNDGPTTSLLELSSSSARLYAKSGESKEEWSKITHQLPEHTTLCDFIHPFIITVSSKSHLSISQINNPNSTTIDTKHNLVSISCIKKPPPSTTITIILLADTNIETGIQGATILTVDYDNNALSITNKLTYSNWLINPLKPLISCLLPGGDILIAHQNQKFIINSIPLLNSKGGLNVDIIKDVEILETMSLFYDKITGHIIALEKAPSDMYFIQQLDAVGKKIKLYETKKIPKTSNSQPLSLSWLSGSSENSHYILISAEEGSIYHQLVSCADGIIEVGLYSLLSPSPMAYPLQNSPNEIICLPDILFHFIPDPPTFCGLIETSIDDRHLYKVCYSGQIFISPIPIQDAFIGKKIYLSSLTEQYPKNITTISLGHKLIGLCLDSKRILLY
jgi:hypothetical protein